MSFVEAAVSFDRALLSNNVFGGGFFAQDDNDAFGDVSFAAMIPSII